jgi:hypothetical protein
MHDQAGAREKIEPDAPDFHRAVHPIREFVDDPGSQPIRIDQVRQKQKQNNSQGQKNSQPSDPSRG